MIFCDELCCYPEICKNPGKFEINYSKYHKVCQFHLPYVSSQAELACSYCKSVCRVIENMIETSLKLLPLCTICGQEYAYNEFTNIGYNCLTNSRCKTCNHVAKNIEYRKDCGHEFCIMCRDSCILCYQICLICSKEGGQINKCHCGHYKCFDCQNKMCTQCIKNLMCATCGKLDFYQGSYKGHYQCENCRPISEPCPNCKNIGQTSKRSCGHLTCSICNSNPCSLCLPCASCNTSSFLYQKDCKHFVCEPCLQLNCPFCCPTHNIPYSILSCNHFSYCNQCSQNTKCPKCSSTSSSINTLDISKTDENSLKNTCLNQSIEKTVGNLTQIEVDPNTESLSYKNRLSTANLTEDNKDFSYYETVKYTFSGSSIQNAKTLVYDKNQKKCPNCGKDAASYKLECLHQGCLDCPDKKACFNCNKKSAKCNNCGNFSQKKAIFLCGHFACSKCISTFCKKCNNCEQKGKCINCSEHKNLCKLLLDNNFECLHKFCFKCAIKQKNKCKFCEIEVKQKQELINNEFDYCDFCGEKIKLNSWRKSCSHKLCEACSKPCPICSEICPNCKSHVKKCNKCARSKCEGNYCTFSTCNYCENIKELKKNCSKCKKYEICTGCLSCLNSFCIECSSTHYCQDFYNPICKSCSIPTKKFITNCPHYFCEGCFKSLKSLCPICNSIESECKTCFLTGFIKLKFDCNHIGCGNCFKNSFGCFKCIFKKRIEIKFKIYERKKCCDCDYMHEKGFYLMCGHFVCKNCSDKDWDEVNYWCVSCNISLATKRKCFLCKNVANFEFEEDIVKKKCCGYSLITKDYKMKSYD